MLNVMNQRSFMIRLTGICLLYLCIQFFINAHVMFHVDEFMFAHFTYQYKNSLPYRDFPPYKSVLGYYLLLLPMMFSHQGIISTLITTKNSLAILNTIMFFTGACWLTRFFTRTSVLISLVFLVFSDLVLFYSTTIRIDLLSFWFCFIALLLLFENRFLIAGIFLGLGFITSQKAIWYIGASNVMLFVLWCCYERQLKTLKNIICCNAMILLVVLFYCTFWAYFAGWHNVLNNLLFEATATYNLDFYSRATIYYWIYVIIFNPFLLFLAPLSFFSIFVTYDGDDKRKERMLMIIFASAVFFCLFIYKQMFPYNLLAAVPVFLVLYAALFQWFFKLFTATHTIKMIGGKFNYYFLLTFYELMIFYFYYRFWLPETYLLMGFIPLVFGVFLLNKTYHQTNNANLFANFIIIISLFMAFIYPIKHISNKLYNLDGSFQKANLNVINHLLSDGSGYIAGAELIYNKNIPIPGMRHLRAPAIQLLYHPTNELRATMMASQYEDPHATIQSVITAIKKSPVKFYIDNYMMQALPPELKTFLDSNYQHFWGSIYLYAPLVSAGSQNIALKFSGTYFIEAPSKSIVVLSGKTYQRSRVYFLKKGVYQSHCNRNYRLKWLPSDLILNKEFQDNDWNKMMYVI